MNNKKYNKDYAGTGAAVTHQLHSHHIQNGNWQDTRKHKAQQHDTILIRIIKTKSQCSTSACTTLKHGINSKSTEQSRAQEWENQKTPPPSNQKKFKMLNTTC